MATGTVKFFNTQNGFGFITPSDGSRDVFVHISAVERAGMSTLREGQRVSYDVVTERGSTGGRGEVPPGEIGRHVHPKVHLRGKKTER